MTPARPRVAYPSADPTVSFIIPVRDAAAHLRRCLRTIAAMDYPAARVEVIVVDNGSTDGSDLVAAGAGARVLRCPGVRVGELRNRGAAAARGELLAFVDADHEIVPEWIWTAVATLRTPEAGAAGAPYHAPSDGTWVQRWYDALRSRRPGCHEVVWLGSGNLAIWKHVFDEVGGFDEGLEACEDVDFCQRVRATGYRVMSDDRLRSIHHGDPRTLGMLFWSELWRGRNNLAVTLRTPLTARSLPSVAIPLIDLAAIVIALVGLAGALAFWMGHSGTSPTLPLFVSAAAVAVIVAFAVIRALMMVARVEKKPTTSLGALAVACVYDVARALAIVARSTHERRRGRNAPAQAAG